MDNRYDEILASKGLKSTPNRILVLKAIDQAGQPVSLSDIDEIVSTMYKATIFRVLCQFVDHDVVHTIDDGSGSAKYELCGGHDACSVDDQHVHFYCERCQRTFCIEDIHVPTVTLPQGYTTHSINYVIKGTCPECNTRM